MKPMHIIRRVLPMLAMLPLIIFALTGCGPKLRVQPAKPLPAPKVAVPAFLKQCPPALSWMKPTCKPAPISTPTP